MSELISKKSVSYFVMALINLVMSITHIKSIIINFSGTIMNAQIYLNSKQSSAE